MKFCNQEKSSSMGFIFMAEYQYVDVVDDAIFHLTKFNPVTEFSEFLGYHVLHHLTPSSYALDGMTLITVHGAWGVGDNKTGSTGIRDELSNFKWIIKMVPCSLDYTQ